MDALTYLTLLCEDSTHLQTVAEQLTQRLHALEQQLMAQGITTYPEAQSFLGDLVSFSAHVAACANIVHERIRVFAEKTTAGSEHEPGSPA